MKVALLLCLSTVAAADPLRVEIAPATRTWKREQPVEVRLIVTNDAKTSQTMKVMSCGWDDHWTSNDAELRWRGFDCDKNFAAQVTLAPGKSREWKLPMFASPAAKLGTHALPLTFTPEGLGASKSNRIAIEVTK